MFGERLLSGAFANAFEFHLPSTHQGNRPSVRPSATQLRSNRADCDADKQMGTRDFPELVWVCADASFGCEKIRSSRDGNPISQNRHPALPAEMLLSDETAESKRERAVTLSVVGSSSGSQCS